MLREAMSNASNAYKPIGSIEGCSDNLYSRYV